MEELTLKVGGMSCMGCVSSVKRLLSALPGVHDVAVDLASGQVLIRYTPGASSPSDFKQAIEDGGYQVLA